MAMNSLDYGPLLEKAGLLLKKANEGKAQSRECAMAGRQQFTHRHPNTVNGTPLYNAGLDVDDQVLSLDGKPLKKQADLMEVLKAHKPGDKLDIEYGSS